jgi:hypothetical protein
MPNHDKENRRVELLAFMLFALSNVGQFLHALIARAETTFSPSGPF